MTAAVSNFKIHLSDLFAQALRAVAPEQAATVLLERPKQASHGDYACNLAMQLAKPLKRSPREIAQALLAALPASPVVEKVEIAGAGFINVFLTTAAKQGVVGNVLQAGSGYGHIQLGAGRKVQVEFVSANPTGPLHVGHGRGAAYGASLSNVLDAAGYQGFPRILCERCRAADGYSGAVHLAALSRITWSQYSVSIECLSRRLRGRHGAANQCGARDEICAYAGQSAECGLSRRPLVAEDSADDHLDALIADAKRLLGEDYAYIHNYVLTEQLGDCRNDLAEFGVNFDEWFSEQSLFDSGLVAQVVCTVKSGRTSLRTGWCAVVPFHRIRR